MAKDATDVGRALGEEPTSNAEALDLLGDGRLLKRVLRPGDGPCPQPGKRLEVHYESFVVSTGAKIDSSRDREEPFDFILGEGDVLEAWDLGVATMAPGELSEFTVQPSLAYGEEGGGDDIPPNAVLRFTIELLTGKAKGASGARGGVEQAAGKPAKASRLQRAADAKDRGNGLIKDQSFAKAREAYQEALDILQSCHFSDLEDLRARGKLRLSCLLNLAQCDLKLEDLASACRHATEALEIDPGNCKALYRRALARMSGGNLQESRADLVEALRLDPQNAEVRRQLDACRRKLSQCHEWEKEAFGGIFGKAPQQQIVSRDLTKLVRVWLDFQVGSGPVHRLRLVLYSDTVPKTAENFRALCTGEHGMGQCGQPLHYQQTLVHKVVSRSMLEAGDLENYDGTGGESIYGPSFADEAFVDKHHRRGLVSMANRGPDSNSSRFFITFRSLPQFDEKNVVFGEVVGSMAALDAVERVETGFQDKPLTQVAIVGCGQGW